jgi:hypothetical protein
MATFVAVNLKREFLQAPYVNGQRNLIFAYAVRAADWMLSILCTNEPSEGFTRRFHTISHVFLKKRTFKQCLFNSMGAAERTAIRSRKCLAVRTQGIGDRPGTLVVSSSTACPGFMKIQFNGAPDPVREACCLCPSSTACPGFTKINANGDALLTAAKFASTAGGGAKNAPKRATSVRCYSVITPASAAFAAETGLIR